MEIPIGTAHILDVIQALDSRTLMGEMRGHDVWLLVKDRLSSLPKTNVLILDMSSAAMLDYGFSGFAFGSLFSDTDFHSLCHQIIFILSNSSRNAFFQGVLKAAQRPTASYPESQDMFVRAGLYCKIAASQGTAIDFVGTLSSDEMTVLTAVNKLNYGPIEQIVAEADLRWEKVHTDLLALASKGFVMEQQTGDYLSYLSYNTFLKQPEA